MAIVLIILFVPLLVIFTIALRKFNNNVKNLIAISDAYAAITSSKQIEMKMLLKTLRNKIDSPQKPTQYIRISDIPEKQFQAIVKVVMKRIELKAAGVKSFSDRETWPEACFNCPNILG